MAKARPILIRGGFVFTAAASGTAYPQGSVLVVGDRIAAVGEEDPAWAKGADCLDAKGAVVLPGLVNAHQHHWYGLFKGLGAGLLLEDWIRDLQVPLGRVLDAETMAAAMHCQAAEMLLCGTTTFFNHMVTKTPPEMVAAMAEAAEELGIRQVFGLALRPDSLAQDLRQARDLLAAWQGNDLRRLGLVVETTSHWVALGTCSDELVKAAHGLAREAGLVVSSHIAGGTMAADRGYLRFVRETGRTDVEYLLRLGVLDDRWLLAHAIWVTDQDVEWLGGSGASVVYCPTSESARGGGVPPVVRLRRSGVRVCLGSDGPMVDDSVDMLEQAKAALLFQNQRHLDPCALSAEEVLCMATRAGAQALGLGGEIGSLEEGKLADIAVFPLSGAAPEVVHRPLRQIVSQGRGRTPRHVLVGGRVVVRDHVLTTRPAEQLRADAEVAAELARQALAKAGLPT